MKQRHISIRHLSVKDLPAPNALNEALCGRRSMNSKTQNGTSQSQVRTLGDLQNLPQRGRTDDR